MKTFDDRRDGILAKYEKKRKRRIRNLSVLISCCMVVVFLTAWLLVPYSTNPPSVAQYRGNPYYSVIEKLNDITYVPPVYRNRLEKLSAGVRSLLSASKNAANGELAGPVDNDAAAPMAPGSDSYQEVTDNQVAGVTESDVFKRSDKYLYQLYWALGGGIELRVYTIAGEASALVGTHVIREVEMNRYATQMYLSADCKTVTVVSLASRGILLMNLDVSDPANIQMTHRAEFDGYSPKTRMVDGQILLTYSKRFSANGVDFQDESTFVPNYSLDGEEGLIAPEDVIVPEHASSACYTVVCKLDGTTLELLDSKALLGYTGSIYVTEDTVFLTNQFAGQTEKADEGYYRRVFTEITGLHYAGDSMDVLGTVALEGTVKDQYSMDAYEGILRVVTSTRKERLHVIDGNLITDRFFTSSRDGNVNLYCVDLSNWEISGKAEGFAPEGEEATSVRFDGKYGYVCTAEVIQLTDPVYFFDLSDPENITWTDTGTIEGYSTSLVQFGNGYLLGIGFTENRNLKIEVYREGESAVGSVCKLEATWDFVQDYKCYYIDRERGYIGLVVYMWEPVHDLSADKYVLIRFDGQQLEVVEAVDSRFDAYTRGVVIEDWLYVLDDQLTVVKI